MSWRRSRAARTSGRLVRKAENERSLPGGVARRDWSTLFRRPATGTVVRRVRSASLYDTSATHGRCGGAGQNHILEPEGNGAEGEFRANLDRYPPSIVG